MALTGLEIYKLLPKTNCRKCGSPTCLAFAMKLAAGQVELSACPELSPEAREALEDALRPTMRLVTLGRGEKRIEIGGETVMFRHEKAFLHPPGILLRIRDTLHLEDARQLVKEVAEYSVEREGMKLTLNGFALENISGELAPFVDLVEMASAKDLPLLLISSSLETLKAALEKVGPTRPAIYAATKDNAEEFIELAKRFSCPLVVKSFNGLEELAELTQRASQASVDDLLLDPGHRGFYDSLLDLTYIRRLALRRGFRSLGYPVITFPGEGAASPEEEMLLAAQHIIRYSNLIVLDHFSPALLFPLLLLRFNLYSDPETPLKVRPGLYPVNDPDEMSPLLITTNFSLTYHCIRDELEAGGWRAWLLVCDTGGLSVLTALGDAKFNGELIARSMKEHQVEKRIGHRNLILPGAAVVLKREVEEQLPGWKALVGPREALEIGEFLRAKGLANTK